MLHILLHSIILGGTGTLWMHIRYPQKIDRESVLQMKYQGSYEKVGKRVMLVILVLIFIGELLVEI
jgi:hypothetical protein